MTAKAPTLMPENDIRPKAPSSPPKPNIKKESIGVSVKYVCELSEDQQPKDVDDLRAWYTYAAYGLGDTPREAYLDWCQSAYLDWQDRLRK